MVGFLAFLTLAGSGFGFLLLVSTAVVTGAPQQAALAGMACAVAIIPYIVYRVAADGRRERLAREQTREVADAVRDLKEHLSKLKPPG